MSHARHFTATGFVVHGDRVLLHWHKKVNAWLPPGGHIEENEDPVQAVVREIREETGIEAKVVPTGPRFDLDYPTQVHPPFTIMIEDIHDPLEGYHQHIDMIYFCQPSGSPGPINDGWQWVSRDDLANDVPLSGEGAPSPVPPPKDVQILAEQAFSIVNGARDRCVNNG